MRARTDGSSSRRNVRLGVAVVPDLGHPVDPALGRVELQRVDILGVAHEDGNKDRREAAAVPRSRLDLDGRLARTSKNRVGLVGFGKVVFVGLQLAFGPNSLTTPAIHSVYPSIVFTSESFGPGSASVTCAWKGAEEETYRFVAFQPFPPSHALKKSTAMPCTQESRPSALQLWHGARVRSRTHLHVARWRVGGSAALERERLRHHV